MLERREEADRGVGSDERVHFPRLEIDGEIDVAIEQEAGEREREGEEDDGDTLTVGRPRFGFAQAEQQGPGDADKHHDPQDDQSCRHDDPETVVGVNRGEKDRR